MLVARMPHSAIPAAESRLSALTELERMLLVLLAVVCERLDARTLGDMFQSLATGAMNTRVTKAEMASMLKKLEAERTVRGPNDTGWGFEVRDDLLHPLLTAAHERGVLATVAECVRTHAPLETEPWRSWRANPVQRCARELRLGLYLNLDPKAVLAYAHCTSQYPPATGRSLVLRAYGLSVPSERLAASEASFVQAYALAAFDTALEQLATLTPVHAPCLLVWARQQRETLDTELRLRACTLATLRGDAALAREFAPAARDTAGHCARLMCALACDDFAGARDAAKQAIESTRVKKSGRIKGIEGVYAGFAVLVLLTAADADALQLAKSQLDSGRTHKATPNVHVALMLLHGFITGQQSSVLEPFNHEFAEDSGWLELLFIGLTRRWRGLPLPKPVNTGLGVQQKRAQAGGYDWVARTLQALLSPSTPAGLLLLYSPEEPWQRTLRALEAAVSSEVVADGNQAVERLAWVIKPAFEGYREIVPRLQTRSGQAWSSGRQVALRRLFEAPPDAGYLTEHDRRVIRHIEIQKDSGRWGSTTSYVFDLAAPLALIGHPLVFLEHDLSASIEVVRGRARLEVEERDQTLRLSLAPAALAQRPLVWDIENGQRAVIYALEAAQRSVANIFAAGSVTLPAKAKTALQGTLAKLAAHFPLASEIAVDAPLIEERPADGRLRVRLRRLSGGIGVRVCVLPLEGAPLFAPGRGSGRVIVAAATGASGTAVSAVRDLAVEAHALTLLYASCPTLRDAAAEQHETTFAAIEPCLELLCELRAASDLVVEWPEGTPISLSREYTLRDVSLRVRSTQDWLAAQGELAVDEQTKLSLLALLEKNRKSDSRFIALDGDKFLALSEGLKKSLDTLDAMARSDADGLELHPLWLGLASLGDDFEHVRCDAKAKARLAQLKEAAALRPKLPKGFGAELREYQHEGYVWLSRLTHLGAGACLADDMGLGKTLQTLALLLAQAKHGPSLVVAPTSVCRNWLDEARRFAPGLRVQILGTGDRAQVVRELQPLDVLVCSYGILQQELELLSKKHFRVVVLDEAQAIKDAATQRSRAAAQLVADMRIGLSGTPIENHIGELWSIMNFLNPGLLGTAKQFEERFAKPIARDADPAAAQLLKRLIRPFILRRRKNDVLDDLPEKTVITLRIEPSEAERALYAALKQDALSRFEQASQTSQARIQILAEISKLRRAACHPKLVTKQDDIPSSKLLAFEELLTELRENGHRTLVFSQFVDHLTLVRQRLDQLQVSYQYLDGSTPSAQRARAVADFQAGEGDAFLISLKAGGSGLNLTAADYVVHLDPWWNPAVEEQASDRAHRIGQTRPVTIYRLVMQDSIEERILALHANKRELADDLLEGTSRASALSLEDLLNLLRDSERQASASPGQARKLTKARTGLDPDRG
jgi:hypothetical protein